MLPIPLLEGDCAREEMMTAKHAGKYEQCSCIAANVLPEWRKVPVAIGIPQLGGGVPKSKGLFGKNPSG